MIEFLAQMPTATMIFITMAVLGLAATLIVLRRLISPAYSLTRRSQCPLKCPQRPSSMVYTVKVHLQRTLADLMFPPHCQSGRG